MKNLVDIDDIDIEIEELGDLGGPETERLERSERPEQDRREHDDAIEIIGLDYEPEPPPKNVIRITVAAVIWAKDAEATIEGVIHSLSGKADHVVVIDDASTDDTPEVAKKAGAVVHTHPYEMGYDRSIDDGFVVAAGLGARIIFTFDAYGHYSADYIPALLTPIAHDEADLVVGRRFISVPAEKKKKKRRKEKAEAEYDDRFLPLSPGEQLFSAYTRKYGVSDPLCGLKAFNVIIYQKVGYYDEIEGLGTHLLLEAARRKYRIGEVSVLYHPPPPAPDYRAAASENIKVLEALYRAYTKIR